MTEEGTLDNQAKLDAIKQKARKEAAAKRASQNRVSLPAVNKNKYTGANQMLAFAGTALVFFGLFCPIISAPIVGMKSFIEMGGKWWYLAPVLLAGFLVFIKNYRYHWLIGSALIVDFSIIIFRVAGIKDELKKNVNEAGADLKGTFMEGAFSDVASAAVDSVSFGVGLPMILFGSVLMIAASFYDGGKQHADRKRPK